MLSNSVNLMPDAAFLSFICYPLTLWQVACDPQQVNVRPSEKPSHSVYDELSSTHFANIFAMLALPQIYGSSEAAHRTVIKGQLTQIPSFKLLIKRQKYCKGGFE